MKEAASTGKVSRSLHQSFKAPSRSGRRAMLGHAAMVTPFSQQIQQQ